jgi:penicillin-binding protein 2
MNYNINSDPFRVGSNFDRSYFIDNKNRHHWKEVDSFVSRTKNDSFESATTLVSQKMINFWLGLITLGFCLLFLRTGYLQLIKGQYFSSVAEGNRIRILDIPANRGIIYDSQKKLLVENVPTFSLAIIPVDLPKEDGEKRDLAQAVAQILNQPLQDVYQLIASQSIFSYQPVVIGENLNQDQSALTRILSSQYPAVVLSIDSSRHYLYGSEILSLSHILGYLGKIEPDKINQYLAAGYLMNDHIGKAGLESAYEKQLRGIYGKQQVEVDATGQAKEILAFQKPVAGENLVLTIDSELQKQSEISLKRALSANNKFRGVVIVQDPNNGAILALISLPAFDNNLFSTGISQKDFSELINNSNQPLFNRSVSGEYPAGSTFKLVVGAAALQDKIVNTNTGFNSVGGIRVSSWFFPDWKAGGHGWTNIYKAIAESVNTYFYIVVGGYNNFTGLGIDRLKDYAEMFGLNKKLGLDLPNEADGFFPSPEWKEENKNEVWYIGDTYHVAIGQGDILVTPLQVAAWTSFFANNGKLYRPYLVSEVINSENKITKKTNPQIISQNFIDPANIQVVRQGMRQGVLSGSSRGLGALPVAVAAKTGTAQWSTDGLPHAWLTSFAPYDNPQIVVTVLIEEGQEGSTVALPVARDIIEWWAQNRLKTQ